MALSDQIKEDLARWRLCFGLVVAAGASIVGWLIPELSQRAAPPVVLGSDLRWVALVTTFLLTALAFFIYLAMGRKTDQLGDLDEQ